MPYSSVYRGIPKNKAEFITLNLYSSLDLVKAYIYMYFFLMLNTEEKLHLAAEDVI